VEKMSPSEKYGAEFLYAAHTLRKSDGIVHPFRDVAVCIKPRGDEVSTFFYAGPHMVGITNGMTLSGVWQIPVEAGGTFDSTEDCRGVFSSKRPQQTPNIRVYN
jgi:hypothetical protein